MNRWLAKLFPDWSEWTEFWTTFEWGRESKGFWLLGFGALFLASIWLYRRDTRALHPAWKIWLWSLRWGSLAALLVVALLPQERKSRTISQFSRVALLVDTSVSMSRQDREGATADALTTVPSRAELVQEVLERSRLLSELRKTHDVSLHTFDSLPVRQLLLPKGAGPPAAGGTEPAERAATSKIESDTTPEPARDEPDWPSLLRPRGSETRLGEALLQVLREEAAETLSGVVIITDGGHNAGIDPQAAAEAAVAAKVRVIAVGVGSTRRPVSLRLAEIQAPTHVHLGDGFTITAFVSGQGVARQPLQIELLSKLESDAGSPMVVETRQEQLLEDGVPINVTFEYLPREPGRRTFQIRARPEKKIDGLSEGTVQDEIAIEVIDRQTKVLLVAGGPMRDYQFVRTLIHRDKTIDVDVLLQTGVPGISQDSDNLLFEFPADREELFKYDVLVGFDPDWGRIAGEDGARLKLLADWVFSQAGGLVVVAGDVNTKQLAGLADAPRAPLEGVLELYPVVLERQRAIDDEEFSQPWPVELTRDGLEAGFLQLTDNPTSSVGAWKEFPGFFRGYPTDGPKAGATVYARFSDPRSTLGTDQPILIASQFYGAGRVFYLGSGEFWRLRAMEEDYYDRFWIKLLREVGQGRLLRGTNRGVLLLEKSQYPLGSTIQVRARILDAQFKDLVASEVPLELLDPSGKPLSPAPTLLADKSRPGHFSGSFVPRQPGNYRLEIPIPDSNDRLKGSVSVRLPNLEFDRPEQNEPLLRALARSEVGGSYLTLDEAADALPGLLPDRTTQKVQYDFPRTLWDRQWVTWLLVGLLSLEWLTRKLLKLA
ncbi:MAG: VWA domain-containing protein [Planctomycetales bacterium]